MNRSFLRRSSRLLALAGLLLSTVAPASATTNLTRFTKNVTVQGTFTASGAAVFSGAVTLSGAITNSGVNTLSGANVITHAPTGLKIQDSDASHLVTIAPGNESANRTLSIPVLGGADTIATLGTAQTFSGAKTFSTAIAGASINSAARRVMQTVRLAPETGVCADATVYRGIIAFGRACTVTKITYGASAVPTSGTNVIAIEKNSFSGNTMLNAATITLNNATICQAATLTATSADLGLTATECVACEYNAGTQDIDAAFTYVTVEAILTDE